jgi:exodeoxyribonuclease VII large subunit
MSQIPLQLIPERKIFSVSELSSGIKGMLESKFPDVWVTGEISNYRGAGSGHLYFTLKDAAAQLRAVCFRNQARYLKFKPADGLAVIARGRLSVYEARGEYQIVVDYLEPAGAGALQVAFEQLKKKLAAAGLFEPSRKKPLPVLPRAVGLVTSPQGAAVRDIIRVLHRRFRNMDIYLYPVKVQGEGAAEEIAKGIEYFNRHAPADVLIVGRGGGSLEDLWAFNEETVARAIAASKIPIISAVGHETDFTIADFVADLRAPTPSAAAELVVHRKQDFLAELQNRARQMAQALRLMVSETRERLTRLLHHRALQALPARISERGQRVDDLVIGMTRACEQMLSQRHRALVNSSAQLLRFEPRRLLELRWTQIQRQLSRLDGSATRLESLIKEKTNASRQAWLERSAGVVRFDFSRFLKLKLAGIEGRLASLDAGLRKRLTQFESKLAHSDALLSERSPLTVLGRGYSITRDAQGRIVRDATQMKLGDEVSVRVARGEMGATVNHIKP